MSDGAGIVMRYFHARSSIDCAEKTVRVHVFVVGSGAESLDQIIPQGMLTPNLINDGITGINRALFDIRHDPDAVMMFVQSNSSWTILDVQILATALVADPLYGFAMPRVANRDQMEGFVHALACLPKDERRVVEGMPVLVSASVFRDFGLLDEQAANLDSALVQLFVRANRRGVSARQVNTVVLLKASDKSVMPRDLHLSRASDYDKAIEAQSVLPEVRFERLLQHHFAPKPVRDILIDIRNLAPGFNGTANHVLSLLAPMSRQAAFHGMRLHFWVLPESAKFHGLGERYGETIIHQLLPDQLFDASIRLTQPWSLTELRDQAFVAPVNIFSVLDTIAWDCHYIRMPHIEGVWRAMADFADGFIYISHFSRQRFNARFQASLGAVNVVAHCSMDPAEYWMEEYGPVSPDADTDAPPYVLIVGNRYYHKGLAEVVPALSVAFPEVHFKVLGECNGSFHNVEQIVSGTQAAESMARLFGHCCCLVFPSFYEGFGLPIFEALAYGKPVLARHSDLIEELRSHMEPSAGLFSFVSINDLLRNLKELLAQYAGQERQGQPAIHPARPYRWEDSATDVLNLIDDLLAREDYSRCRKRLEFFYRLEMFDVERAGWTDAKQNMVGFEVEKEE